MDVDPIVMGGTLEGQLGERYQKIWELIELTLAASWVKVEPAVPFVGKEYDVVKGLKVLVYGSAENLNFEFDPIQLTHFRNRDRYDAWRKDTTPKWFPSIHMTPVSDGTLLTAARYLLQICDYKGFAERPDDFIQQIAIGNYGKFSLKGTNKDYANKPDLLRASDDLVLDDLDTLKPDIVILPRSIYDHAFSRLLKRSTHKPKALIRIYQTNPGVINRHIETQLRSAGLLETNYRTGWVAEWLAHIPSHIRIDRYLDWIDWHMSGHGTRRPKWQMKVPSS